MDGNRDLNEAAEGNPIAIEAWNRQQEYLAWASANATSLCPTGSARAVLTQQRALFLDIHGQNHEEQWTEFG